MNKYYREFQQLIHLSEEQMREFEESYNMFMAEEIKKLREDTCNALKNNTIKHILEN